jgi:hypothetical protein
MKTAKSINIIGLPSIDVPIPESLDPEVKEYVERLIDNIDQTINSALAKELCEDGQNEVQLDRKLNGYCPYGCEEEDGTCLSTRDVEEHLRMCPKTKEYVRRESYRNKRVDKLRNEVWALLLKYAAPGHCKVNQKFWTELLKFDHADWHDTHEAVWRFGREGKLDIFNAESGVPDLYIRPQTYLCNDCGLFVDSNAEPEEHYPVCADRRYWIESRLEGEGETFHDVYPFTRTYFGTMRKLHG